MTDVTDLETEIPAFLRDGVFVQPGPQPRAVKPLPRESDMDGADTAGAVAKVLDVRTGIMTAAELSGERVVDVKKAAAAMLEDVRQKFAAFREHVERQLAETEKRVEQGLTETVDDIEKVTEEIRAAAYEKAAEIDKDLSEFRALVSRQSVAAHILRKGMFEVFERAKNGDPDA